MKNLIINLIRIGIGIAGVAYLYFTVVNLVF